MPPGAQGSSVPARALADGLGPDPVLVDKDAQGTAVDFNARSRKASRNIRLLVIVSARRIPRSGPPATARVYVTVLERFEQCNLKVARHADQR